MCANADPDRTPVPGPSRSTTPRSTWALRFGSPGADDPALVGGKGASLTELSRVPGISVPDGFVVTTEAYRAFVAAPKLQALIAELEAVSTCAVAAALSGAPEGWPGAAGRARALAHDLRAAIANTIVSDDLKAEIRSAYRAVAHDGKRFYAVAVRSSATSEDVPQASAAGQQDTFLNILDEDDVIERVRDCYGSLFSDRAIEYRNVTRLAETRRKAAPETTAPPTPGDSAFSHDRVALAVVVQRMIDAELSGVGFNVDPSSGRPAIVIEAGYGLGEAIVGGRMTPDRWIFDPDARALQDSRLGVKTCAFFPSPSGVVLEDLDSDKRDSYVMPVRQARRVAEQLNLVARRYHERFGYTYIDAEFAVDRAGRIFWLQARPETVWSRREAGTGIVCSGIELAVARAAEILFEGGDTGFQGATSGRLRVVRTLDEAEALVQPGDILVTPMTDPRWSVVLPTVGAVCVDMGGITCHTAIVARELGKPCILDAGDATERLADLDGRTVTLDANNRVIYAGVLPVVTGSPAQFRRNDISREPRLARTHHVHRIDQDVPFIGKPEYPLAGWQLELYLEAWDRVQEDVGVELRVEVHDNTIYVPQADLQAVSVCMSGWNIDQLEEWLFRRARFLDDFVDLAQRFEARVVDLRELRRIYPEMIACFHLRWQFGAQVLEPMLQECLKNLPTDMKPLVLQGAVAAEESETRRSIREYGELLARCRPYAEILANASAAQEALEVLATCDPTLACDIRRHAREFKFDKDDIRLPVPVLTVVNGLRRDVCADEAPRTAAVPVAAAAPVDWKAFVSDRDRDACERLLELAAAQTLQKENEHHRQVRAQWLIRDKLLELGERLSRAGRIERPEAVLAASFEQLLAWTSADETGEQGAADAWTGKASNGLGIQPPHVSLPRPGFTDDWSTALQALRDRDEVVMETRGGCTPVCRRQEIGADAFDSIRDLFARQRHVVYGGRSALDRDGAPRRESFIKIFERGRTVDYAIFERRGGLELVRGSYFRKKTPDDQILFVVLQNSERANRPGRPGAGAARATGGEARMQKLRPREVVQNSPLELRLEWTGPRGRLWWIMINPFPIWPNEEGDPTFPQPYHVTFSRGDADVDQPAIVEPANMLDALDCLVRLNRSSGLRSELKFRMGINGWYCSDAPSAPKAGASQFQAHAHLLRFPFPLERARWRMIGANAGVEVGVLDDSEPGSALILKAHPDDSDALVGLLRRAHARIVEKGDSFNVLVAPAGDPDERLSLLLTDKVRGTPDPYFTNEWAFCESARAIVVDNPASFYRLLPIEQAAYDGFVRRLEEADAGRLAESEKARIQREMIDWIDRRKERGQIRGVRRDLLARVKAATDVTCAPKHQIFEIAASLLR